MTKATDDKLARLDAAIERLEARLLDVPVINPTAVNADGSPGYVAPGELIESAWGNSVSDTLQLYATHVSHRGGVTQKGKLLIFTGTAVMTTNVSGDAVVTFPGAFVAPPLVVATGAEPGQPFLFTLRGASTTTVTFSVRTLENTLVQNGACAVAYIAIGQRA